MSRKTLLSPRDIVLFGEDGGEGRCQLKNFLYFLNSIGAKRPIKFSYVEAQVQVGLGATSPKEYLLDCVDSGPWEDKELALRKILEENPNPAVMELLARAGDWAQALAPMPAHERKLLGLLKGLLKPADYLFLERPELDLSETDLLIFQNALHGHIRSTNQVVFISTSQEDLWPNFFNKQVQRAHNSEFRMLTRTPSVHEGRVEETGHLRMHLPTSSPIKKSA